MQLTCHTDGKRCSLPAILTDETSDERGRVQVCSLLQGLEILPQVRGQRQLGGGAGGQRRTGGQGWMGGRSGGWWVRVVSADTLLHQHLLETQWESPVQSLRYFVILV